MVGVEGLILILKMRFSLSFARRIEDGTSSHIRNKKGESGSPCLIPLEGETSLLEELLMRTLYDTEDVS